MKFVLKKESTQSYEDAVENAVEALKKQGFGVLTEINVKDTLKKKIDVDFKKYIILGACNPPLAHSVLSSQPDMGVLLPCNVVVYEDDSGKTQVSAFNPALMSDMVTDQTVLDAAQSVQGKLELVMNDIQ